METQPSPSPIPRPLFVYCLLYGGMTCIAGVLGFKQVALASGLAVEAGIFAFLLLVVISSSVAQLYDPATANRMVRWGFVPLAVSIALIGIVLYLPPAPAMPPENVTAFETVFTQTPRIMAAGPVAYFVSLWLNVRIFSALRGSGDDRGGWWMMARGAIASSLSQVVDTLIFITVAFYGEFPIGSLIVGQMIAKVVLSIVLVPPLIALFVRLGRRWDSR